MTGNRGENLAVAWRADWVGVGEVMGVESKEEEEEGEGQSGYNTVKISEFKSF